MQGWDGFREAGAPSFITHFTFILHGVKQDGLSKLLSMHPFGVVVREPGSYWRGAALTADNSTKNVSSGGWLTSEAFSDLILHSAHCTLHSTLRLQPRKLVCAND